MSTEQRDEQTRVGERSLVTFGVAAFLILQAGAAGWWASGISTRLDMLIQKEDKNAVEVGSMRGRLEKLEKDNDMFVQVGSPALRVRLDSLEKRVGDLAKDFEVHVETTKGGNANGKATQ